MSYRNWLCAVGVACASLFSLSATADFINPLVPAWRGTSASDFYGWESFTSAFGGPNLPNYPGTEPGAALFNYGPGASLTTNGNIHSGGPLSVSVYGGLTGPVQEVILNLASLGTIISSDSVQLTLADNSGNSLSVSPMWGELRSSTETGGGYTQTRAYRWDIGWLPFAPTRFILDFASYGGNITLDAVSADLRYAPIPAPGALALLAVSGLFGANGRRRRR
ncbi:MAG: hypothetical protein EXS01_06540 [Phycisphaerales bacterium]|nr:hypothetical protein [Phycisphaerales bacterium]